jgi:hypothetical protein
MGCRRSYDHDTAADNLRQAVADVKFGAPRFVEGKSDS